MPTTEAPKLHPPMEAANPAQLQLQLQQQQQPGAQAIVATQPKSEPRPSSSAGNEMSLRGGGFTHYCGYTCCDGRCHFRIC
ncbi:hypothetical protein VTH06DRAFT_7441 [Thermothelomyces fergusii]